MIEILIKTNILNFIHTLFYPYDILFPYINIIKHINLNIYCSVVLMPIFTFSHICLLITGSLFLLNIHRHLR